MTADQDKGLDNALARVRTVLGADGRAWTVREVAPAKYDRRGQPSLVFENPDAMRRVRRYPANWFELSVADLYAVSLGT